MNPEFLSHLHSSAVMMSQKSSLIHFPKSVSQALMVDSFHVRFGSKADIEHHSHLRPLLGVKRTLASCPLYVRL